MNNYPLNITHLIFTHIQSRNLYSVFQTMLKTYLEYALKEKAEFFPDYQF